MNKEIKDLLDEYRKITMLYWHIAGDDENTKDLRTRSYEKLLLECVEMATVIMKCNISEYEYETRRNKNE